jgi:multisubunit Na+/H+ antiporter MnhC subunit
MMIYLLALILFCVGLYGVLSRRSLIKMIVGTIISEHAVLLFFILLGYRMDGRAPILSADSTILQMVDPLPQALVLTAIVIDLATTALLIALAMRLYEKHGSYDVITMRELKG